MSALVKYWTFHKLNAQGKAIPEEITQAKIFILQQYPDRENQNTYSDAVIQRHLFGLFRNQNAIAEICLRCFISEQIKQICLNLEGKYGESHQFKWYDLLPFVLDDALNRPEQPETGEYISMATKVLQTFDPEQANLSTWTNRLVRSERNLNQFLLEHGVYLISDWAILNDTNPQQLHRIFKEFYNYNDGIIGDTIVLLKAYHEIYRQQRLAARKSGTRSKCSAPTPEQLQQISQIIGLSITPEKILNQLQNLAERLRKYRIFVRGGKIEQDSLDNQENHDIQNKFKQQQTTEFSDDSEQEAQEFLNRYRQQFLSCLETAIASVITQWLNKQKQPKKQQFLDALKLFHCQGLSMTDIASIIGLQQQYQVTRLIQLNNLRSDIQQKMLQDLRPQILEIASIYTDAEQLLKQEKQIEIALAEQLSSMFEEAKVEASTVKGQPLKSIFAQYLCRYLDSQEN